MRIKITVEIVATNVIASRRLMAVPATPTLESNSNHLKLTVMFTKNLEKIISNNIPLQNPPPYLWQAHNQFPSSSFS